MPDSWPNTGPAFDAQKARFDAEKAAVAADPVTQTNSIKARFTNDGVLRGFSGEPLPVLNKWGRLTRPQGDPYRLSYRFPDGTSSALAIDSTSATWKQYPLTSPTLLELNSATARPHSDGTRVIWG